MANAPFSQRALTSWKIGGGPWPRCGRGSPRNVRPAAGDRQIADLAGDQQRGPGMEPDLLRQAVWPLGPGQRLGQFGKSGAADRAPGLYRRHAKRRRKMALAGPGGTNRILPNIRVATRRSPIRSIHAAAIARGLCAAIGSAGPGCRSCSSLAGRLRRFRHGCSSHLRRRCPSAGIRASHRRRCANSASLPMLPYPRPRNRLEERGMEPQGAPRQGNFPGLIEPGAAMSPPTRAALMPLLAALRLETLAAGEPAAGPREDGNGEDRA